MAKQTSAWEDRSLRSLARRQVALPVEAVELTQDALRRRANRLVLIMAAAEFVALATIFAVAGIFPGFIDHDRITVEGDAELWLVGVLIGLPAGSALLVRWLVQSRIRARPDEADHPWRFLATREGLSVTNAGNGRLEGPWSDWTYAGYRYISVKHNRIPTGIKIACQGTVIFLELSRFRRRVALDLIRAVMQGLESVGHTDRVQ
jgi:hypothetical protein